MTFAGDRSDRATPGFGVATVVDGRAARWVQVDPWPVSVTGRGPVCRVGGATRGTYPIDTPWETLHHTGAFSVANPDGDAFNLSEGAERFTVRGAHTTSIHDDVLWADQAPNHGSLLLPEGSGVECSGVTVVWLGSGPCPEAASWRQRCPDTRIVTDVAIWDGAVRAWSAAHAG